MPFKKQGCFGKESQNQGHFGKEPYKNRAFLGKRRVKSGVLCKKDPVPVLVTATLGGYDW